MLPPIGEDTPPLPDAIADFETALAQELAQQLDWLHVELDARY
jgi:hypothetical protein